MSKNNYNKYSKSIRIIATILFMLFFGSMIIPLMVGR